jgi:glycosyltransferase involved in cell wall biosynthesis
MRVGYVVKRYPRYSETFIVNEILAHEAAGMNVEIFALRPPLDTHFQNRISRVLGPVHYLPTTGKASSFWSALTRASALLPDIWPSLSCASGEDVLDVHQAVSLAAEIHERQISHLHAHFATSAASVARMAARFAGIAYTLTAHAKDIFHNDVSVSDLSRRLRDAAAVITVSDYNVAYLKREFGQSAQKVVRVYNGLDLEEYRFSCPRNRSPLIVGVGRLIPKKGFATLIEACAILADRDCEYQCQMIGGGELESSLRELIRRLGLQDRVQMLGPCPQNEVIVRLQDASVFAAPCVIGDDGNRDGLPTVLLEAMALGTPCVSTDVTGIPEVLRNEETGLLVAQNDAVSLADAMQRLLTDASLRARLAEHARELIQTDFDIHRNAAEIRERFYAAQKSVVPSSDPTPAGAP